MTVIFSVEKATGQLTDDLDNTLRIVYSDSYYQTIYNIQKDFGVGFGISKIDNAKLRKLINKQPES